MKEEVVIKKMDVLSDKRVPLRFYEVDVKKPDGSTLTQKREIYEQGNAVAVLLYNKEKGTVLLTRQFRLAGYLNGKNGYLVETCAGLMDDGNGPDEVAKKEIREETGYDVKSVTKIFEAYTSPGSYTEKIFYYVAAYKPEQKVSEGGGLEEESEEVEVLEWPFEKAYGMIETGEIQDAKTIMLLQYAKINGLL